MKRLTLALAAVLLTGKAYASDITIKDATNSQLRNVKQYIEFSLGVDHGNSKIALYDLQVTLEGANTSIMPSINYLMNFNVGYGLSFKTNGIHPNYTTEGKTFAMLDTYSVGVSSSIFTFDRISSFSTMDTSLGEPVNSEVQVNLKQVYTFMLRGSANLFSTKYYNLGLVGGLGLALHHSDVSLISTVLDGTKRFRQHDSTYKAQLAYLLGIKQEVFITQDVALTLETSYINVGKPTHDIEDEVYSNNYNMTVKNSGILNANLGLKVYI